MDDVDKLKSNAQILKWMQVCALLQFWFPFPNFEFVLVSQQGIVFPFFILAFYFHFPFTFPFRFHLWIFRSVVSLYSTSFYYFTLTFQFALVSWGRSRRITYSPCQRRPPTAWIQSTHFVLPIIIIVFYKGKKQTTTNVKKSNKLLPGMLSCSIPKIGVIGLVRPSKHYFADLI